jgi:lipopolysaccharide transport system permease protein
VDPILVITPKRAGNPLRDLLGHREVLWSLTLREVQVRYRQAVLGVAWAVIQPLGLVVVTTVVFQTFLGLETADVPYPVFVVAGLVPWTFFHAAVSAAVPSIVSNASLVRKTWFPREVVPLAAIAGVLLDLLVTAALWIGLLLLYGGRWEATLLWAPLLLAPAVAAATACGLAGAAVNVWFRDVKHALPLVLQVLFFATPVVYGLDRVPEGLRPLYLLNPLAGVADGLRRVGWEGRAPDTGATLAAFASSFVLLVVAYATFKRVDRRFADVV